MSTTVQEQNGTVATQTTEANPFDKCVLLSLTVNELGVTRKVSAESVTVDTDKSMIRVSKRILDCEEYKAIKTVVGQFKKYLRNRVVPGAKFFKAGVYAVPLAFLEEIDAKLAEFVVTFGGTVTKFVEVYEARAEEARVRLKVLADQLEYPSVEKVRQAFGVSSEYVTLGPPSSLASISKDIWQRENRKIQASCMQAVGDVRDAMRTMFAELVQHMTERLTPDATGKTKKLDKRMIPNFREFIDTFAGRNITDDAVLAELVEKTQKILAGKSVETLRKNPDVRVQVREGMQQVKATLDTMIVDAPARSIDLED